MTAIQTAAPSILQTSLHHFGQAAQRLNIDPSLAAKIREPRERIEISLTPTLPNGPMLSLKAFIVRHNDLLGPAKGGTRMTPDVTIEDVSGLAMEMTWKTALIGVPFGGGKSGIRCDPKSLTPDAKEVIIRSFTRGAQRHLGPEIYIAAPDMGTNEADMAHISDCVSYSAGKAITAGCFVTGKPVILGGIVGRREATGKGVVYTILAACRNRGLEVEDMRVAVQGFGNVGSAAAAEITQHGAKVIAASDVSCGVVNENGLDVEALAGYIAATGAIEGFAGGEAIDNQDLFEVDCDILIPAAGGSQITADNAARITARIIAEGANSPTTPRADDLLNEKDVFIIPDILCNAGGVFVSYLEYTQETQREQMTLPEVETRLRDRMGQCFDEVYDYATEHGTSMRMAAMDLAVGRVIEAAKARGFLP